MKPLPLLSGLLLVLSLLSVSCSSNSSAQSSPQTTAYIENKGSDTIVNLALAWAERYQAEHPDVRISVTGGGSGTGIASLINGTVDIANASRQINKKRSGKRSQKESTRSNMLLPGMRLLSLSTHKTP
jgi:phosphate transport system substrate-binding protein